MQFTTILSQQPSTTDRVLGLGLGTAALIFVLAIILGALILFLGALISILRSPRYTVAGRAVWIFLVLAFPFLGPLVWFVWGRKSSFTAEPSSTYT
ncbi:PLD nuclease N-terminal domain-containing protein [Actinomycetes bacterium M1A6_2h]